LLLGPDLVEQLAPERRGVHGDAETAVDPGELLHDERVLQVAQALAAVLIGDGDGHEALVGDRVDQLAGPLLGLVGVPSVLGKLLLRELAGGFLDLLLLPAEVELHGSPSQPPGKSLAEGQRRRRVVRRRGTGRCA
jgi:hypothetical protein